MRAERAQSRQRILPDVEHIVPHWYMYPPKSSFGPVAGRVEILDDSPTIARGLCSVYVHIPFCRMRCSFCSLLTTPDTTEESIDGYVDHIVREIEHFGTLLSAEPPLVGTVYFGGGTPSLLRADHLTRIMSALRNTLPFADSWIGSAEFAPDTVTSERAAMWREAGFGRASLGVQTFDDGLLAAMRREHSAASAESATQILNHASFAEINIDLIFGSAGQRTEQWARDLDRVLEVSPTSCTFHPGVAHSKTVLEHKSRFATVEPVDKKRLHRQAVDFFESQGWVRTSVLSYTRTGRPNPLEDYEASGSPTIGFGVSARSYFPTQHFAAAPYHARTPTRRVIQDYYDLVSAGKLPFMSTATLDAEERLRRDVILGVNRGRVFLKTIRALDALTEDGEADRVTCAMVDRGLISQTLPDVIELTAAGAVEAGEIGFWYSSAAVRDALSKMNGDRG